MRSWISPVRERSLRALSARSRARSLERGAGGGRVGRCGAREGVAPVAARGVGGRGGDAPRGGGAGAGDADDDLGVALVGGRAGVGPLFEPLGEGEVVLAAPGVGGVLDDGLPEGGGLADAGVEADGRRDDAVLEGAPELGEHVAGHRALGVVHRREHGVGDGPAQPAPEGAEGLDLALGAVHGEEGGLDGDDGLARGAEGAEGEEADRGGAVEDAVLEAVGELREGAGEAEVAVGLVGEAAPCGFEAGEGDGAGRELESFGDGPEEARLVDRALGAAQEEVGGAEIDVFLGDRERGGAVGLRVEVHEEGGASERGESAGEVDGCGGLPAAALLVDDRDGAHSAFPSVLGRPDRAPPAGASLVTRRLLPDGCIGRWVPIASK